MIFALTNLILFAFLAYLKYTTAYWAFTGDVASTSKWIKLSIGVSNVLSLLTVFFTGIVLVTLEYFIYHSERKSAVEKAKNMHRERPAANRPVAEAIKQGVATRVDMLKSVAMPTQSAT